MLLSFDFPSRFVPLKIVLDYGNNSVREIAKKLADKCISQYQPLIATNEHSNRISAPRSRFLARQTNDLLPPEHPRRITAAALRIKPKDFAGRL